jgi:hypothetical protein
MCGGFAQHRVDQNDLKPASRHATRLRVRHRLSGLLALCLAWTPAIVAAETWRSIGPPGGPVSSLAVDPTDPLHLLLASPSGEVFESRDAGASWVRTPGLPPPSTSVALGPTTQWAGTPSGIWRRPSGDAQWTQTTNTRLVERVVADPTDDLVAWAIVDNSPPYEGHVVRTVDGGGSWLDIPLRHPVGDVLLDPDHPTTAYISLLAKRAMTLPSCAAGGSSGGVFRVTNRGESLVLISTGFEYAQHVVCGTSHMPTWGGVGGVAIAPTAPRTLWATTSEGNPPLYRSINDGASWTSVDGAFPFPNGAVVRASGHSVYAFGPLQATTLVRSDDGGETWTTVYEVPIDQIDPLDRRNLVVSGERLYVTSIGDVGLTRSPDGGATWSDDNPDLITSDVLAVRVEPDLPDTVLAGTRARWTAARRGRGAPCAGRCSSSRPHRPCPPPSMLPRAGASPSARTAGRHGARHREVASLRDRSRRPRDTAVAHVRDRGHGLRYGAEHRRR